MATYPDHARARKAFEAALALAESGKPLPTEWVDRIDRIASGRAKTYVPVLGTALLARATDDKVDPLTLKASADHAHGLRAYTARGLGHQVLVPLAQLHGVDLRVHGREPLNNSPFFRADRVNRGMEAKYKDELEYLVDALEALKSLTRGEAGLALAGFIRHGRATMAAAGMPIPLFPTGVDLPNLLLLTSTFVAADPEAGKRGQAMVAAAFDLAFARVETQNVFASSRRVPGDVVVRQAGPVPIEVRQKQVEAKDVIAFLVSVQAAGIHEAGYAAIDPKQASLPWAALVRAAAEEYAVALWIETTAVSLLARAALMAGDPDRFVAEFPGRMMARLEELEVRRSSREEWANLVAGSATQT
jgi:SacI restriction endonuclease